MILPFPPPEEVCPWVLYSNRRELYDETMILNNCSFRGKIAGSYRNGFPFPELVARGQVIGYHDKKKG